MGRNALELRQRESRSDPDGIHGSGGHARDIRGGGQRRRGAPALPQATANVLLPVLAQGSAAAGVDRSLRVFRYTSVVTVGGIVVAAVLGPELLTLLFGSAYDASTVPFLWLLPGAIGFAAISVFSSALLAASSPGRSSVGPMVALVTGLGLDLILIPPFGASGAAAAASAALLAGGGRNHQVVSLPRHVSVACRMPGPIRRDRAL